jgi:hypothetical protein
MELLSQAGSSLPGFIPHRDLLLDRTAAQRPALTQDFFE